MLLELVVALMAAGGQSASAVDVSTVTVTPAAAVVEIDMGKLKGELRRLSWSPDGAEFYIQTAEADTRLGWKLRHYLVARDGKPPRSVGEEPPWSVAYWDWKSGQAAPGVPGMKIEIDRQTKLVNTTATPKGGDLARGGVTSGMGISSAEATDAAQKVQNANIITLRLKGEVLGEYVNAPVFPGFAFGWGPTRSGLVAFAGSAGRLVLMDEQGRKQEIADSKAVVLPGWTQDGTRLAWLEKIGRKKFTLRVADVSVRTP